MKKYLEVIKTKVDNGIIAIRAYEGRKALNTLGPDNKPLYAGIKITRLDEVMTLDRDDILSDKRIDVSVPIKSIYNTDSYPLWKYVFIADEVEV